MLRVVLLGSFLYDHKLTFCGGPRGRWPYWFVNCTYVVLDAVSSHDTLWAVLTYCILALCVEVLCVKAALVKHSVVSRVQLSAYWWMLKLCCYVLRIYFCVTYWLGLLSAIFSLTPRAPVGWGFGHSNGWRHILSAGPQLPSCALPPLGGVRPEGSHVNSLHELLLSLYCILKLLLHVDQVLLQGTQLQTQPLLFLDKQKWSKYTSQKRNMQKKTK